MSSNPAIHSPQSEIPNLQSKKHLIMGTAGHIDHGKTALVNALTGIDCDTHKEEKQRGITIHLGFACLELPQGDIVGIVDVPGHKDFIRTMVAGASGIDFALLVVAADSGIMPQTTEHLQIMEVLGIRRGLVALTKIDLVDEDVLQIAQEEVAEFLCGTSLEGAPTICVSSTTGQGIAELKDHIAKHVAHISSRPQGQVFRMFVDRIFPIKGFGTVVTGSVMGGHLSAGSKAFLLPGDKELRVRRIERHGHEVPKVTAGDRASVNLTGLNREEFRRGMLISDRILRTTTLLDAKLRLFPHAGQLALWSCPHFHLGTYEAQVRVHLIDHDALHGGEASLEQIHLHTPCVAQSGDRFVIRASSGDQTLGGGEIIDAFPLHHRRRTEPLIENMSKIAQGRLPELVASEARKRYGAVTHQEIADALNVSPEEILSVVNKDLPEDILAIQAHSTVCLVLRSVYERWQSISLRSIEAFHKRNPLEGGGRSIEEVMGSIGIGQDNASEMVLREIFTALQKENKLKRVGNTWALYDHDVKIGPEMSGQIQFLSGFLKSSGMQTPLMSEMERKVLQQGINEKALKQVLRYLVRNGQAYFVDGNYIHASIVNRCRTDLLRALSSREQGMTVAEFRNLVHGNRKICLLLLSIFDSEGVTVRKDDVRIITDKGKALI